MDELIFAGNKYISSKRASKLTGYTTDYIGQICRADKIQCRLVGRNWYINERDIERNKKSFKKEQALSYNEQTRLAVGQAGTIEYEKISPELLYYSNDKRSLNLEVSKTVAGEREANQELISLESKEKNERDIPIRIIKKPEVSVEKYNQPRIIVPKTDKQIAVRKQRTVSQYKMYEGYPLVAAIILMLMLAGALFIAGTATLEQVIHYSSKDKTSIDTSIQLANITNFFKF